MATHPAGTGRPGTACGSALHSEVEGAHAGRAPVVDDRRDGTRQEYPWVDP